MSARPRIVLARWQIIFTLWLTFIYSASAASPSMNKLFHLFLGDWTVSETFPTNEFFPHGGHRQGEAHFTVGTGGTSLIEDYHSNGSAGKLDFLLVIWWVRKHGSIRCLPAPTIPITPDPCAAPRIGKVTLW